MKKLLIINTLVFSVMFLSPNVVLSETVKWDDLVIREGLYYKKFTDVPFTGKTSGKEQGSFKNGKKEGPWVIYWDNGQLWKKGNYRNGKEEGPWVIYWDNGQLLGKNNYRNGKEEGPHVSYWDNGQLGYKGNHKNGLKEGPWVAYNKDGTVRKDNTGTYKDGRKISD
jgi:antitoxin component YwqK of YwqJK toxin-antitoxin module